MTTITVNGTLTLDQSSGVQSGSDGDDIAIGADLAGLPESFRAFLLGLPGTFLTPGGFLFADEAEAASTTGGSAFITVDPGEADIDQLFFSNADGSAFDGDQVFIDGGAPMQTIDGDDIFLHSYEDGQVVLATTSATRDAGEVVAAFYLDPSEDLLSAEVTMVTFQAIDHPDGGDGDDSVDFGSLLNVSVNGSLSFDFDGLSSGNFLHVSVGGTGAGLLVTGRNLAVDGDGDIVKGGQGSSDSINTSQGGQGSTIGINSQMFSPGEIGVFSLVTNQTIGTSTNVNEVDYDDFLDVTEVGVFLSQFQGDDFVNLRISTFSAGGVNTDAESGESYIFTDTANDTGDALGDDDEITITNVVVFDENGEAIANPGAAGLTITIDPDGLGELGDHIVQVDGLQVLWTVKVFTTDTFNRFHVESVLGDFDIGRIDLADQGLTVTTPIGDALVIDDDAPVVDLVAANGADVIVDETADDGDENGSGFLAQVTVAVGSYLSVNTADAGTDGEASDVFAFADPGTDIGSGLIDTASNEAIVLNLEGDDIVGRTATSNLEVMRWEIDATTGEVTLSLKRAIVHDDFPNDPDENDDPEMLSGSNLIVVTRTVVDNDDDSASASADLTSFFKFEDDGPGAALSAQPVSFLIDETDGSELAPGEVDPAGGDLGSVTITGANLFTDTSVFGTDGQAASDATVYDLLLSGANAVSGLTDTQSGEAVLLNLVGDDIVGTTAVGGDEVLRISINAATGDTTVTLSRAVVHNVTDDPDEAATPAVLNASTLFLRVTVTDGDQDTSSAQFDLGALVAIEDDGPAVTATGAAIPDLVTDDSEITDTASASFAGLFSASFASDGFKDADDDDVEDTDALAYTLGIKSADVDSGLDDTLSGDNILLRLDGTTVEGYLANDTGTLAFTVSVDADTGEVTLSQLRSVVHNDAGDPVETGASAAMLDSADLITLTATATDGDGDQASNTVNIGGAIAMEDDGPSIERTMAVIPTLITDDTDVSDSVSASFAALFTSAFGNDGFKDVDDDDVEDTDAVAYTLSINPLDDNSGLVDTQSGDDILLRVNAGVIEGFLENDPGTVAFQVSVDATTGEVTLTQLRAIFHDNINDPVETGAEAEQLAAADLIRLTATVTDGDGDQASAAADIGLAFLFEDDGPGLGPIDDFVVDYTADPEGTGSTTLNATVSNDLDPDLRITGFRGDGVIPVVVNGIELTSQLSNDQTKVFYYQDLGVQGAFDGGIEDILYYTYELIDTDADTFLDTAEFIVHTAPSAGNLVFNLDELPSGQNLFGILAAKAEGETAINPDGPSLIVIGRDVSLDADGTSDSDSDTVNTSQGGGPTTIANSNQIIEAGEGLFFAYVVDPEDSFISGFNDGVVEGLDQGEADDADNIQYFGGTLEAGGAGFEISQIQGNDPADLRITAYNGTGTGTDGSGLQMRDFALNPIAGATQVAVIAVRVFDEDGNLIEDTSNLGAFDDPDIEIDLNPADDPLSALVFGLDEKYSVEFITDELHDISLIEGVGGMFDIGGIQLLEAIPTPDQIFNFELSHTDGDGDSETAGHSVRIDGTGIFDDDPLPIGTDSDDTLIGTPGDDIMLGFGGNDLLIPNAGIDVVDGGDDTDTVDYSTSDAGIDVTLGGAVSGGHATGDTLISIENVIGTDFVDTITGDAGDNVIEGGGSGDDLEGGDGVDTLSYANAAAGVVAVLNGVGTGGDAAGDVSTGFENLTGSEFADTLTGDGNGNVILGLGGDDLIAGLAGADMIDGGADNDTVDYSASGSAVTVTVNGVASGGDAAGDQLSNVENLVGSGFDDELTGDGGDNVLTGGAGADVLDGGGGNDTADYAGSGNGVTVTVNGAGLGGDAEGDTLSGIENLIGSGFADTLTGDGAANTLEGGNGADVLAGLGGADALFGGDGSDTADYSASGSGVTVTVNGAASGGDATGDTLAGIENLIGSAFADTLTGDGAANTLDGGDGADVLAGLGGGDALFGGDGIDTADYSASGAGVNVTVNGPASGGDATGDTLSGLENLIGTEFADTLTGDGNANVISGLGGDDLIAGLAGADVIDGGGDTDTVDYSASGSAVIVTVNGVGSAGDAAGDQLSNVENLIGSAFDDELTGDGGDNVLTGNAGADMLDGGGGNDTADYAGSGSGVTVTVNGAGFGGDAEGDTLSGLENLIGSAFADTLTGDAAVNTLEGGNGADVLAGLGGADALLGGEGSDTADYSASGSGVTVTVNGAASGGDAEGDTLANLENLIGSVFGDTLIGDDAANTLDGGDGADVLAGLGGADVLIGGDGIDTVDYSASGSGVTVAINGSGSGGDAAGDMLSGVENLIGSAFDDTLTGDGGDNVLTGGAGADMLDGGGGNDTADYAGSGSGVTVTVNGAGLGGDAEGDTLSGIENLIGSAFADVLTGDAAANTLDGGDGADVLAGLGGADALFGGDGIDTADYSASGAGVSVTVNGAGSGGDAEGDILVGIENLIGSAFNDVLIGDVGDNVLIGGGGADEIDGGDGIDTVDYSLAPTTAPPTGAGIQAFLDGTPGFGGEADGDALVNVENLIGSDFNDVLGGDGGMNTLSGGDGFDILVGADGGVQDVLDGGAEIDIAFYFSAGEGQVVDLSDHTDPMKNSGEHMADIWVSIEGFFGAFGFSNDLTGDENANFLLGGNLQDTISGSGGDDQLSGLDGDDVLEGGTGIDALAGGAGTDTLTGGADTDIFYVETGNEIDIVTDWVEAEDLFLFFQTGVQSFADLTFTDTTPGAGGNVEITSALDTSFTIIVENVEITDLDEADRYLFF